MTHQDITYSITYVSCALLLCLGACSPEQDQATPSPTTQDMTPGVDLSVQDMPTMDAGTTPEDMMDVGLDMGGTDMSPQDMSPQDMPSQDMPDQADPDRGHVIPDPGHQSNTAQQLADFYATYGGRDAFPPAHVNAIEALLYAEDDLIAGDKAAAFTRVEGIFAQQPRADRSWHLGSSAGTAGSNTGAPVGYYGLRMVEHIHNIELTPTHNAPLIMTGVIAPCTQARLPQPEGTAPINAVVDLHPRVLEHNARILFLATGLFRQWVRAITQGSELELRLVVLDDCTTTDFTDDGSTVVSYPDTQSMVDAVPIALANDTDIWWVISPSGVQSTETEIGRHSITGGMGLSRDGRPLIISDDLWFVRKPDHMGKGAWTEVELRAYHPQWFQHEFMHHLFRSWPEFELEVTGHQWFDRSTWPSDFEGTFEPDYYHEAIMKRLVTSSPSLAQGLAAPDFAHADEFLLSDFVGTYRHDPVENNWHEVTVTLDQGQLTWRNAAGVSWSLNVQGTTMFTGADCPYGVMPLSIETENGDIKALIMNGGVYDRVP